jgi:hypothetical protein
VIGAIAGSKGRQSALAGARGNGRCAGKETGKVVRAIHDIRHLRGLSPVRPGGNKNESASDRCSDLTCRVAQLGSPHFKQKKKPVRIEMSRLPDSMPGMMPLSFAGIADHPRV